MATTDLRPGLLGLRLVKGFRERPLETLALLGRGVDQRPFRMGPLRFLLVNEPSQIGEVLVTRARSFRKQPRATRQLATVDGQGLVVTEGDVWARQRRLIQPIFRRERLAAYAEPIVRHTARAVAGWPTGSPFDLAEAMTHLTLSVIAELLFGEGDLGDDAQALAAAVRTISEVVVAELGQAVILPDWAPLPSKRRKRAAIRILDDLVRGFIRERRERPVDRDDLLARLLCTEDGGGRMSEEQVRDETVTLFNAGHDTTAAGLAWVWARLGRSEAWMAKVEEEARALGHAPGFDDLARLPLTEQVVKEALRIDPPTWLLFNREAIEDVEIGGSRVRRGTIVMISPWLTQRDGRFFEDPERFDPERFAAPRASAIPSYAYIPFGAGGHRCIGLNLAMLEMVLVVATVLQHGRPILDSGPIEPDPQIATRPRGGLPARWQCA